MEIEELELKITEMSKEMEQLKSDLESKDKMIKEKDEKITSLQHVNQELFIRATKPEGTKPEKQRKTIEEIVKEMRKK